MQLNSKNRREVVEDILDIKIFSLMNLVLKTKVREVNTNMTDAEHGVDLTQSKIEMQERYIKDANDNRENLLTEKKNLIANNEEEIFQNRKKELAIKEQNESILDKMVGESKATEKRDKLKDYQFSLKDKHNRNQSMISFLEKNDECPTCEQQIDKEFKTRSIQVREKDNVESVLSHHLILH